MGFKDSYIYKTVEAFFIGNADDCRINVEAATRKTGTNSLSGQLERKATTLQVQTLKNWKLAILLATDPEEPNRAPLKDLYFSLMLDNHLMATIMNRIETVQGSPFKMVDKNLTEDPEKTNLFKRNWFIDFIKTALFKDYSGTTVIEMYKIGEDSHLKEVEAVDMAHIIPEKGLIVKEPGDVTGWNYKEGVFKDYYLQVGKDSDLGLFAMLAPIVLAKKLGIGSWLDYIEKYGIPPMFVTTDREDRKRFEELYENMLNFKSNHFGVLRGDETVQFGTSAQAGNSNVFEDLAKLANDEISKRINGATGSTDEKAHVGAAQVHADILNTKIRLDKFFIQVLVNEELIPRLVKLSPVYAGLENYTFEWDDTETLNLDELIDAVVSLSAHYEIDIEYLSEKTGIPITGLKQLVPSLPTPDYKKGEKKKSKVNPNQSATLIREFYEDLIDGLQVEAIDLSIYTKLVERAAKPLPMF